MLYVFRLYLLRQLKLFSLKSAFYQFFNACKCQFSTLHWYTIFKKITYINNAEIMKAIILMAFCLVTTLSCREKGTGVFSTAPSHKSKRIIYTDTKGTHYKFFGDIPDSLRTPEQKLYAKSTADILLNGVAVENNHVILKFSKKECLAKGMTEKDYNELQTNLRDSNHLFDSTGNKRVDTIIGNMQKSLKDYHLVNKM